MSQQRHPGQGQPGGLRPSNPQLHGQGQLPQNHQVVQPPAGPIRFSTPGQSVHITQPPPVSQYNPPRMSAPAAHHPTYNTNPAQLHSHPAFTSQMQSQPGRGIQNQMPRFGMNRPQQMPPQQPHYHPQHPTYQNQPFSGGNPSGHSTYRFPNPQINQPQSFIPGPNPGVNANPGFYSNRPTIVPQYSYSGYQIPVHQANQPQGGHPNQTQSVPSGGAGTNINSNEFIPGMASQWGAPQQPQQQTHQKRQSRAIPITDPETGKAVDVTGKATTPTPTSGANTSDDKKPRSRQASESQPRSRQASESQVAPNATPPVSQPEKSAEKKDAEPERREKTEEKKEEVPKKPVIEIAEDVKNVKDVKEAKDVKE